jgi:hypothetical protein
MEKEDYIVILKKRLREKAKQFSKITGSQFARPQTVIDLWQFLSDIKTVCALTHGNYSVMIDTYAGLAGVDKDDLMAYASYGEWIALDRSTRSMESDDYDDFWGNPENQPNILIAPVKDDNIYNEIELLNEMWEL